MSKYRPSERATYISLQHTYTYNKETNKQTSVHKNNPSLLLYVLHYDYKVFMFSLYLVTK